MVKDDLKIIHSLIFISAFLVFLFIIKSSWIFLLSSFFVSLLGIVLLWWIEPYHSIDYVKFLIHRKFGEGSNSFVLRKMKEHLNIRAKYFVGKNNFIIFSLLTYSLTLATLFKELKSVFKSLKDDSIGNYLMDFFEVFGGDYVVLGFFIVLVTGLSLIYLTLSTRFRKEFNIFTKYQGDY